MHPIRIPGRTIVKCFLVDVGQALHHCLTKGLVILANGLKHFSATPQTSWNINKNIEKRFKKLVCREILRVAVLFHLLAVLHIFHDRLEGTERRVWFPIKELIDVVKVPGSFC